MNTAEMTAKIAEGKGFIAALDQSGGSTPKALKGYGIEEGAWSSEALARAFSVVSAVAPTTTGTRPETARTTVSTILTLS